MSKKRWRDTGYLKSNPKKVDQAAGVITGVKVCSEGEAKGHGFSLDPEFIENVAALGNGFRRGLKARFGHPNMCSESLGTYIGRFKNFTTGKTSREDGTEATCCFADLHLSETAKDTPNGDLHKYVMGMAENEEDMFGTSIVFIQGPTYRKNTAGEKVYPYNVDGDRNSEFRETPGPDYIECEKLMACDCVDEPAANDGLFSAFSGETVAGQITEFLDLNPQVFEALTKSPEIMEAIVLHGEKFDEFLERYQNHKMETTMPPKEEKTEKKKEEIQGKKPEVVSQEKGPAAEQETEELSVEEQVAAALKVDRKRQADIRELGAKFGFAKDAEKFAADGKSLEEFREHILSQSPGKWRETLSIKNPSTQETEHDLQSAAEGNEAVEKIKKKRQARFGTA